MINLPRGKNVVLKAEDKDYDRGLVVKLLEDGGYDVYYWYNDPKKVYPAEIKIDGESVTKDGKIVHIGFHPELENESVNEKVNPDIKQIYKLLIKYGQSAKDTAQMMKKHWKHVSKKYARSSPRGMAMALIGLHALGERIKRKNESADTESNPAYFKGLSKKDKEERERVIKRRSKMKSNDPDAYKGFRSDKGVKTKPSKHNAKFKKMFGELSEHEKKIFTEKLSAKIKKSLKNKAKKANAPMSALTTIYNKGLAAWRTGHRPGASQHAWAMARVNSVLTGGKARKVDAAQWKQISKHRKK